MPDIWQFGTQAKVIGRPWYLRQTAGKLALFAMTNCMNGQGHHLDWSAVDKHFVVLCNRS